MENDDIEEESAVIEEIWDDFDEKDPGYGLLQEDDIEKAIFGDCLNESEDEEEDEGYDEALPPGIVRELDEGEHAR